MKRFGLIILGIVLLVCSGCSTPQNNHPSHQAPPKAIHFESSGDYEEFSTIRNHSDKDIATFIEEKNFSLNGIRSKDELIDASERISEQLIPVVAGYQITSFAYYPENESIYIHYEGNAGTMTYSVRSDRTAAEEYIKENESKNIDKLICSKDDFDVYLMKVDSTDYQAFLIDSSSFMGMLKVFGSGADAYKIVSEKLEFKTLDYVASQKGSWSESLAE